MPGSGRKRAHQRMLGWPQATCEPSEFSRRRKARRPPSTSSTTRPRRCSSASSANHRHRYRDIRSTSGVKLPLPQRRGQSSCRSSHPLCLAKIAIHRWISYIGAYAVSPGFPCQTYAMLRLLRLLFDLLDRSSCSRRDLLLENLSLRQQLAVLKRRRPQPRFKASDRLFWVLLCLLWPGWKQALILVQPETVVRWHRSRFKLYWKWLSRHRSCAGRKCISKELRKLIFRLVAENRTWGPPRIHGELKMLDFDISERTVSRWMRKAPRSPEPAKRWAPFLRNHRGAIAAMDFFTIPTLAFDVLYCVL
jgi:hypothetical protein